MYPHPDFEYSTFQGEPHFLNIHLARSESADVDPSYLEGAIDPINNNIFVYHYPSQFQIGLS